MVAILIPTNGNKVIPYNFDILTRIPLHKKNARLCSEHLINLLLVP